MEDQLQIRVHGQATQPTLIYLPGLHGDWTLVSSFRAALKGQIRFVEITYPLTVEWSLTDYADAVTDALASHRINQGWLLGESFSSQVAWAILERASQNSFRMEGLILSGGFVRHPIMAGVHLARLINRAMPIWMVKVFCALWARYAKLRHRHAPETLAGISAFVKNRTNEADRQAICHRYDLIIDNDLRSVARQARLPVFQLTGFFDPIVPWPLVQPWLKRNCPDFRGWKLIWRADHNPLGTAPRVAAEWVLRWMKIPPKAA